MKRLEKEIDALPDKVGSASENSIVEYGKNEKGNKQRKSATQMYNLKELALAYKSLTEDMNLNGNTDQVRIIIDV